MAASAQEVANQALVELGSATRVGPNFLSAQTNDVERSCAAIYPDFRDAALTLHPWAFTVVKAQLTSPTAPLTRYEWEFALPTLDPPILPGAGPLAVFAAAGAHVPPETNWMFQNGKVQAGHTALWIDIQVRKPESAWPPLFTRFAVMGLAARLANPVTEMASKAAEKHQLAYGNPSDNSEGGYLGEAKRGLARYSPPRALPLDDGPFTRARFGR
jgi:hypothetical protein